MTAHTYKIITSCLFLLALAVSAPAQQTSDDVPLQKDYSFVMEIPSVTNLLGTPTHMYVMSNDEGLVLFRTNPDTLQWLYTSPKMQRRGNQLRADIRFAYQFGNGERLTVLEPSSILGVYSSTELPVAPEDITRINDMAFIALDSLGLGQIDLQSPESVDTTFSVVESTLTRDQNVVAVENSLNRLFALSDQNQLAIFEQEKGNLNSVRSLELSEPIQTIHVTRDELLGSTGNGSVYRIDARGTRDKLFEIGKPIKKLLSWKDHFIIKDMADNLWLIENRKTPKLWKKASSDVFFATVIKGQLWVCEYNKISRVNYRDSLARQESSSGASLSAMQNSELGLDPVQERKVVPYPQPLLMHLGLATDYPASKVQYTYKGPLSNVKIRGQSLYWQPGSNDVGTHPFKIIASGADGQVDSLSFDVEVNSFNAPPRFSPIRTMSIMQEETFTLPVTARDPDGMNPELIRYMGVDLPNGASIDAKTGTFKWTPSRRQVGKYTFQIIATDQFGAASQVDVTLNVLEPQAQGQQP